ncbi:MAG: hypothetical protein E5W69_03880, partial [Mesorhizobium sp.]
MRIQSCTLFLFLGLCLTSLSPARAAVGDCGDAAALVQQAYPKARKSADGTSFMLEPHVGDIELLVIDRKSLRVRQRLLQPGLMTDDMIVIEKVEFDTGRYALAPDVTAFGLRIEMAHHSLTAPFT